MGETLKPCPFCGESNARAFPQTCKQSDPERAGDRAYPIVRCMTCYCEVGGENFPKMFGDVTSAITEWNTRSGDLIPRDEITPQMAAEVLLSDQSHVQAISRSLRHEEYLVLIARVYAALTAIKESKDEH